MDPIALSIALVEAIERNDLDELRRLVPERYWGWVDDSLLPEMWPALDEFTGPDRVLVATRLVGPPTARLTFRGAAGEAFVTMTFDVGGQLTGFAVRDEEFEGIGTIVVTCPDDRTSELGAFYAALLGDDGRRPRLRFDEGRGYQAPRWPDPRYPQQMHLDIDVSDLDRVSATVEALGATLLRDSGGWRTYADPIGHPFCLYPSGGDGLRRVVIDCPDAAELEAFYVALRGSDDVPRLAFQEVSPYVAPRWPDPGFGAQMHFDVAVDDRGPVQERIERAGARLLPPQGGSCPVFADPAGHPFCLCIHGE